MVTEAFPRLQENKFIIALNAFFRSRYYMASVVALMTCSALFGAELAVYYCILALAVLVLLFGDDTVGLVPLACCSYMTVSAKNNPAYYGTTTMLAKPAVYGQIIAILVVAFVLMAARLISCVLRNREKGIPKLSLGYLALGAFYLLGGAFSPYYTGANVLYALLQILSVCIFYFFFYYTIDWRRTEREYILRLFTVIGVGLLLEIIGMYFNEGVFTESGVNRIRLFTGWGTYNTVGCVMAMCMAAPFYFSVARKNGWVYTLLGTLFFLGVVLTQSRGSILFGGVIYILCTVAVIYKSRKRERLWNIIVYAAFLVALGIAALVFREKLARLFSSLLNVKLTDSGRFILFRESIENFKKYPVFGVGWMDVKDFENGVTDNYYSHNTILQALNSGGIFLLLAYLYHRVQTAVLLFRNPSLEKLFIALAIGSLLTTCIVDCHIFSFGPGVLYSVLLAFGEGNDKTRENFAVKTGEQT